MNDFDLNDQLKALQPPQLKEEYWEDFPGRVMVKTRRQPQIPLPAARASWLPQLAWGFGLALGCLVLGYFIGHDGVPQKVSRALQENQQEIRMSVASFPGNLQSFMLDESNLQKLVPEQQ